MESTSERDAPAAASPSGRRLFVICRYGPERARQRNSSVASSWLAARLRGLTLPGLRAYIAANRDFYANPRSAAYLLDLARAERAADGDDDVDLLLDAGPGDASTQAEGFERVSHLDLGAPGAWREAMSSDLREIVLFYPDPIGLGQQVLEREVLRGGVPVCVVTGRRRRFAMDPRRQRMLAWRRWLAQSRVFELALGIAVVPVAALCALGDAVRGRS